jgi:hypothetical protein
MLIQRPDGQKANSRNGRLVVGVLFVASTLLCGLLALIVSNRAANRVEGLQPVGAAALMSSPPGTEVLIEAHLSDENPVLLEPYRFVVYVREGRSVRDDEGTWETGSWSQQEQVTPPLLLDLTGSVVQIENDDYKLQDAHSVEAGGVAGEPSDTRFTGLRAGEPVLVVGTVLGGKEVGRVQAEFVAGGTQASYVAGQRSAGWIFGAASLVVALLGGATLLHEPLAVMWASRRGHQQG